MPERGVVPPDATSSNRRIVMSRWVRSAEVSKNLIIVLVILVLVVGGYWTYRWRSRASEMKVSTGDGVVKLYCPGREEPYEFSRAEGLKLPKEGDKVQNPETKKFDCTWGKRPSANDAIRVP
jgi:hypothetical protein